MQNDAPDTLGSTGLKSDPREGLGAPSSSRNRRLSLELLDGRRLESEELGTDVDASAVHFDSTEFPVTLEERTTRLQLPILSKEPPKSSSKERGLTGSGEGSRRGNVLIFATAFGAIGALGWWFGFALPQRQEAENRRIEEARFATTAEEHRLARLQKAAEAKQVEQERLTKEAEAQRVAAAEEEKKRQLAESNAREVKRLDDERRATEAAQAELASKIANASKQQPFENSLGLLFVPAGSSKVLFSVWPTRVEDFEKFSAATGYDATKGMESWVPTKKKLTKRQDGGDWKNPGFEQTAKHPVIGISWKDAEAFCAWLTATERERGLIGATQEYRLPTDAEWSVAAGKTKYPWGNAFSPKAGNYAGEENRGEWTALIRGFKDEAKRTSVVGKYRANEFGLVDMGGNVAQWCSDSYRSEMNDKALLKSFPNLKADGGGLRVVRGSSWRSSAPEEIQLSLRNAEPPESRTTTIGFRCVLAEVVPKQGE